MIGGGIVLVLFAFVTSVLVFAFGLLRGSEVTRLAVERAQASPSVVQQLGTPVKLGLFVNGQINVTATSGRADLEIPIKGPKAKATIYAVADKRAGLWSFSSLEIGFDEGRRLDLLSTANP
jgi:hypothetical protein